jgi:hypothetical protein
MVPAPRIGAWEAEMLGRRGRTPRQTKRVAVVGDSWAFVGWNAGHLMHGTIISVRAVRRRKKNEDTPASTVCLRLEDVDEDVTVPSHHLWS